MAADQYYPKRTTRSRVIDVAAGRYRQVAFFVPSTGPQAGMKTNQSVATGSYKFAGTQYTESEGHPFHSSKQKGMTDLGGEFFTQKRRTIIGGHQDLIIQGAPSGGANPGKSVYEISGPVLAVDPGSVPYPSDAYSNDVELDAQGATAISRVKPTNPVAGLTAALAEIRTGGLPHLPASQQYWRDGTQKALNAGSEYLNVQFGWMPLVNDIGEFSHGVTHAEQVVNQYRAGIGKPIRRSYYFPTETSTSETLISLNRRPWTGHTGTTPWLATGSSAGALFKRHEVTRERWFKGCFTYYFPAELFGSKGLADMAIMAHQLGLVPTPDVVWQITPWSWAIDWFSNVGDVISNYSSFHVDGLVLRYGYMMEHTIVKDTYSLVGAKAFNGQAYPVGDVVKVIETKLRRKANPYGFGVSWDGLNPFQASILVALGISR